MKLAMLYIRFPSYNLRNSYQQGNFNLFNLCRTGIKKSIVFGAQESSSSGGGGGMLTRHVREVHFLTSGGKWDFKADGTVGIEFTDFQKNRNF